MWCATRSGEVGADNAGKLSQRNLSYDSGFTLEPGDDTLRFLARENVTGKMGPRTRFTVPGSWRRIEVAAP